MGLSKTEILSASDQKTLLIEVPEWDGDVFVRTLSGAERDALDVTWRGIANGERAATLNFRARFAVLVLSNEAGDRLFTDADADALGKKSGVVLDRVLTEGFEFNGMGKDDIKELEGNSEAVPSGGSGSE